MDSCFFDWVIHEDFCTVRFSLSRLSKGYFRASCAAERVRSQWRGWRLGCARAGLHPSGFTVTVIWASWLSFWDRRRFARLVDSGTKEPLVLRQSPPAAQSRSWFISSFLTRALLRSTDSRKKRQSWRAWETVRERATSVRKSLLHSHQLRFNLLYFH